MAVGSIANSNLPPTIQGICESMGGNREIPTDLYI